MPKPAQDLKRFLTASFRSKTLGNCFEKGWENVLTKGLSEGPGGEYVLIGPSNTSECALARIWMPFFFNRDVFIKRKTRK